MGKDKATLQLIEQIIKSEEEDARRMPEVKKEHVVKEGEMTTSCGVPGFSIELEKVIAIKAIAGTKRLLERQQFKIENRIRYISPVETF